MPNHKYYVYWQVNEEPYGLLTTLRANSAKQARDEVLVNYPNTATCLNTTAEPLMYRPRPGTTIYEYPRGTLYIQKGAKR